MAWHKGQSGNPAGRPKGALNKRLRTIADTLERLGYDPFEKKVRMALRLEAKIHRNHFDAFEEKIAYLGLYAEVLKDLLQYAYPKLRAVEHFGQLEILHKLQNLHEIPDAELDALIADAEELANAYS